MQKRIRIWDGLPFAGRVLIGCLVVALVPMLVSNISIINLFDALLRSQASAEAVRQVDEMEQRLDVAFETYARVSQEVADNHIITKALIDSTYGLYTEVNLALYKAGNHLPPGSVLSLYDVGGKRRFTTDNQTAYASLPVRWGVLQKAGKTGAMVYYNTEKGGRTIPPYAMHTAQRLFTEDGIMVGYVVISVPDSVLRSTFAGLFPEQSSVLLLDAGGDSVYGSGTVLAEDIREVHRSILQGRGEYTSGNNTFYLRGNARSGFYLVLRQPRPITGSALRTMRRVQLSMSLVSLLLCILFSLFISRSLTRPVSRLSAAMEKVKKGELDIRVEARQSDQLGRLAQDFNLMAEELQQYMDKVVRQQQEMDESRMRLLQAQLNPHFLYNTLDTVKWLAKINQIPEIASISSNLALILRQCVSSDSFITLQQELDTIRGYVDIQRIRFSGKFQYVVNMPDSLADCILPKLILQPIVENAIIHGLANKEGGYVYIYAVADGEDLRIAVTDDGCGMPADIVEKLNHSDSRILDGHLGLYNVSHIIKIHYGPQYGLQASVRKGVGTTVTVRLPIEK